MNKSQNENQSNHIFEIDNVICEFEKSVKKLGKNGLENLMKKINYLCLHYNPYENYELSIEEENIINELKLNHHLSDPFIFTNVLLQMLDIVENQLKTKIQ